MSIARSRHHTSALYVVPVCYDVHMVLTDHIIYMWLQTGSAEAEQNVALLDVNVPMDLWRGFKEVRASFCAHLSISPAQMWLPND